ncbi:MAG: DUF11 domain-containing protein [Anaerolineae bacterium]|nr:DUF11 domain-containing protein [Anaerolineae bacterium]
MNGIRRGSRAAMLWTGILLMAVLATALVAASYHSPVLARQDGVTINKEASVETIPPADLPFTIYYTVTFSNSNESDVVLAVVTDTLPTGFSFITVENPVEWTWPVTASEPTLVWEGPITVPATSTLSLVYSVEVSDSVPAALDAYVNNLEAETDTGIYLGPASAPVYVRAPDLALTKRVSPSQVEPGDVVTFTVTLENNGFMTSTVAAITDTLDAGLTFEGMVTGPDPAVDGNRLVWTDTIPVPPLSSVVLVYQASTSTDVPWTSLCNQAEAMADGQLLGPAEACVLALPDLAMTKSVSHSRVEPGDVVTFTVTLENSGFMTSTVAAITDTLDAGLLFEGMVSGPDPAQEGNTLVWTGTIEVPPLSSEMLVYTASVSADVAWVDLCNQVEATADGELLGPAETCFFVRPDKLYAYLPIMYKNYRFARIEIEREVTPSPAVTNQTVVYAAAIKNAGETTGRIVKISDTLPAGFTYVDMVDSSSDVKTDPAIVNGTLVWTGDWAMAPGYTLDVVYEIKVAGPAGDYVSSMVVDAVQAHEPLDPATVTLRIEQAIAGLEATNDSPTLQGEATTLSASVTAGTDVVYSWDFGDGTTGTGQQVTHVYPAVDVYTATVTAENGVSTATDTTVVTINPPTLIDEDFEDGWEDWTEFLNYHRLAPGQWYWDPDDGYNSSGGMTQNAYAVANKEAEDALLMWLQPGAEDWTDYRMEAKIILRTVHYPQGFWVRGQYKDVGSSDTAGWVTGYYIMLGGSATGTTHYVSLKQLQTTEDCWDQACNNPENLYDFNNPHELTITKKDGVLARHQWHTVAIEVRDANIKVWLNDVLYIDYTDNKYPFLTGTVGLKTMKADTVTFDDIVVTPLD